MRTEQTPRDPDVWRCANLLLWRFGDGAQAHCAERIDAMDRADDSEGGAVWTRLHDAVREFQRRCGPADTRN